MIKVKIHITVILLVITSVLNINLFIPNNFIVTGGPAPPNDSIDGIQFIEGNWSINNTQSYSDEIIILSGNLTILNGGNLTFNNVTLMMNCTNFDGEFNIEVQTEGSFNILYDSNITDSPFDTDNSSAWDYEYMFWVREGSNFTMIDSELNECGWDVVNVGLRIFTDKVTMINNIISNNYFGIHFFSSSNNTILGNKIFNNSKSGIFHWDANNCNISDNKIYNNLEYGIIFQKSSYNYIYSNEINNNGGGLGINYVCENNIFLENSIYNNNDYGISISNTNNNNTFINTYISNHQYGVSIFWWSINNIFVNCSISNSSSYDIKLDDDSHIITINTTFNESNVYYEDTISTLTFKWFVDVYVNISDGTPLPFASSYINDTFGNPIQGSPILTDENGYIRLLPITEYVEQDASGDNVGEKTYMNPYNISVKKGGYSGYADPEPVIDANKQVNITLIVPPQGQLHHIDIDPVGPEDYYVNDNVIYQAVGWNDAGETEENITWVPRWSVDDPSIAMINPSTGYFIGTDIGTSFVDVTSRSPTGIFQTSEFNVLPWPLHHIQIIPQGPNTYHLDDLESYTAIGWNDAAQTQQNSSFSPSWSVNNTSIASIDPSTGEFTALDFGYGTINVSHSTSPNIFNTILFTVIARPLHHIDIIQEDSKRYYIGDEITYTAIGWNDENEIYQNMTWKPVWSVNDPPIATINNVTGEFKAIARGSSEINVTSSIFTGIYNITDFIIESWPLHHIVIMQDGSETYYIGDTQTYTTIGWNDAEETQLNTSWTPVWNIDDTTIASIDSSLGDFTTLSLGSGNVMVSAASLPQISNTSSFTVDPWPLHHIEIIPNNSGNYYIGESNNYMIIGWNDEAETQENTSWTAIWNIENTSLATINESGFFTANALGSGVINVSSLSQPWIYMHITFKIHPWSLHHISIEPAGFKTYEIGDIANYSVIGWNDIDETQLNTSWVPIWTLDGIIQELTSDGQEAIFEAIKAGEGSIKCSDDITDIYVTSELEVLKEDSDGDSGWIWILIIIVIIIILVIIFLLFYWKRNQQNNKKKD